MPGPLDGLFSNGLSILVAVVVGLVAVGAPILISLYLARAQSFAEQMREAVRLAAEVRRRSDASSDQAYEAFHALEATHAENPCSDDNIELMKRLKLQGDGLGVVGYMSGDSLRCSSLGRSDTGIALGPPDFLTSTGAYVRVAARLPLVPGKEFFVSTRAASGYTVMVHRDLLMELSVLEPFTALGAVGYSTGRLNMHVGPFDKRWLERLGRRSSAEFFDGRNLVSIQRSAKYDFAAYAAVPVENVAAGLGRFATVLVPIGILAGVALALAVVYVTRSWLGLPSIVRVALRRNEFFVNYQPIVDLRSGAWVGAEALVRWRRPNGELIRPDLFVGMAEDSGLIGYITERVAGLVAAEARDLFRRHPSFYLSINLAAADLQSGRTVELVRNLMKITAAGAGNVVLEATERSFINEADARETVTGLRALGARMAIDDFGTGYSSLARLESLQIDCLKIDKSFVDTVGTKAPTGSVVLHIIELAKDLGLDVIAEGVETEEQAAVLRKLGVRYAQGWLYGKAMPYEELISRYGEQQRTALNHADS